MKEEGSQITDFLNANQGIRIYRDGFRVKPYGEPDGTGDWLNLSYERQRSPQGVAQEPLGGWRVGYNQVIGAIFISREKNTALIDQTNRESIVEGLAFFDLRMFAIPHPCSTLDPVGLQTLPKLHPSPVHKNPEVRRRDPQDFLHFLRLRTFHLPQNEGISRF